MRVSRRAMLKGGAVVGSALAVPAFAVEIQQLPVVVFDSGIAESLAFAAAQNGLRSVDLRKGGVRGVLPLDSPRNVTGLTRWSDWTALRGLLEESGLRVTEEIRVPGRVSGRDHLFRWTMVAR